MDGGKAASNRRQAAPYPRKIAVTEIEPFQGLRYDPTLLWIDDADRQAKWYQQLKREWTAAAREKRAFVNPVEPVTLRWRS